MILQITLQTLPLRASKNLIAASFSILLQKKSGPRHHNFNLKQSEERCSRRRSSKYGRIQVSKSGNVG
jgi:hypothetical protein